MPDTFLGTGSKAVNKESWQPMDWEKIFVNNATYKGLISKIYKQLEQLNNNKKKNGQKNWTDISTKKTYRWPTGKWKDAQHC